MSRSRKHSLPLAAVALLLLTAGIAPVHADLYTTGLGFRDFADLGDQPNNKIGIIDVSFLIDLETASVATCEAFAGSYDQGADPQTGKPVGLAGIKSRLKWEVVGMACPTVEEFGDCKKTKRLAAGKVNFTTLGGADLGSTETATLAINFAKVEAALPKGCCPYFLSATKGKGALPVGQAKVYCEISD